jgi:hypothetical protein
MLEHDGESDMRSVRITRYDGKQKKRVPDGRGRLLGWGVDSETDGSEPYPFHFTVAIVEREDGTVQLLHPNSIQFETTPPSKVEALQSEVARLKSDNGRLRKDLQQAHHQLTDMRTELKRSRTASKR